MDYAEAVNMLNDEVSTALAAAERRGLTQLECIEELERMIKDLRQWSAAQKPASKKKRR